MYSIQQQTGFNFLCAVITQLYSIDYDTVVFTTSSYSQLLNI